MSEKAETHIPQNARSLTATLAVAFVALSVVTLLAASSLQLYFNMRTQQALVASEQRVIAQDAANEVSSFIKERFGELESVVKFSGLINASPETAEQILELQLGSQLAFRQLAYLDGEGQPVAQASRLSQAARKEVVNQLEPGTLLQTEQGDRYISPVYLDDLTFEPLVAIAVPAQDVFKDFQGTLVAEVNLKFMWELVDRLEVGQTGLAYVIDRQGNLLAFGDTTKVLAGENVSHLDEVADFASGIGPPVEIAQQGTRIYRGINDTNVLSQFVPLGTPDWAVVTELPVAEAYEDVRQNVVIFVVIFLAIAVFAALAGAYLARRLAAPVQHLTETADQVAQGNLRLKVQPEGAAEFQVLANAFNLMTAQLNELIGSLEDRVAARTQRLEVVATLSGQLLAILDVEQLLSELVDQTASSFGYYHAHVYLIDQESQNLVVAAGAGEAGAAMKAQEYSIPLDAPTSLVARAARSGQVVSVDNVREAPDWLPNPLLPDTYSEMAVPIVLEGSVIGVLDVQQDTIGGLDEGDAGLLRSLANQAATAIRNVRLFEEVNAALSGAQAAQERYLAQAWETVRVTAPIRERLYTRPNAPELAEEVLSRTTEQALALTKPAVISINDSGMASKSIVSPVMLGGRKIGALQVYRTDATGTDSPWSEADLSVVEAILDQVAQSAENLRLFDETQERADSERTLREIAEKMRSATSLDRLLKIAAEELGQQLSVEYARIDMGIEAQSAPTEISVQNGQK
jgi:GAF domain-containing protein/HAMP domain-containing protein